MLTAVAAFVLALALLQEGSPQELLAQGRAQFLEGRYDEAVRSLRRALPELEESSDRLASHLTLALIYQVQGDDERTLMELQWALVEDPDLVLDADLYSPKTRSLMERARTGALDRLLRAKQNFNAGMLALALEEFELSALLLAATGDESMTENVLDARLSSALIHQTLGENDAARARFRDALVLRPALELDTDFYAPSTVELFREVKDRGPRALDAARALIADDQPGRAQALLNEQQDAFLAPENELEARVLSSYASFQLAERDAATTGLTSVFESQPSLALDSSFYSEPFRTLAENVRIAATRGLPRIAVVLSSDAAVHQASSRGFEQVAQAQYTRMVLTEDAGVLDEMSASDVDLVYVLGQEALDAVRDCCPGAPVIAGNLPASSTSALDESGYGGVLWNVSVEAQIPVALRALPSVTRVGTVVGPSGSALESALRAGLESLEVTLVVERVDQASDVSRAVGDLMDDVDLFWYLPDPVMASVDVFAGVRSACDEARVPIYAFHESLVREGAYVGVSADFEGLGRQAARMALSYLAAGDRGRLQLVPAAASRVVINLDTAGRLGVEPDPNLVSLAATVYR